MNLKNAIKNGKLSKFIKEQEKKGTSANPKRFAATLASMAQRKLKPTRKTSSRRSSGS